MKRPELFDVADPQPERAKALGLPLFVRGMAQSIEAELAHFGKDGLVPGDILVTNDAYTTGSHLNHFTFTLPIRQDRGQAKTG